MEWEREECSLELAAGNRRLVEWEREECSLVLAVCNRRLVGWEECKLVLGAGNHRVWEE